MKSRVGFFEKINQIDKYLLKTKNKRQDPNKIRNERVNIINNATEIQRLYETIWINYMAINWII